MLIVDTGFLVVLYIRRDKLHSEALKFLQQNNQALITVAPVIVESCYFLDAKAKNAGLALQKTGRLFSVTDKILANRIPKKQEVSITQQPFYFSLLSSYFYFFFKFYAQINF